MAKPATILLVEDDEQSRELAVELLEKAGHRVVQARDTDEARARLAAGLPDLVLLDIRLPGEEGTALLDDLRFLPGGGAIPVVACTAYNHPEDRAQLIGAGCDGFVGKPFKSEFLLETVRRFLRDGRTAGQAAES